MKKFLLTAILFLLSSFSVQIFAQRFISEVFTSTTVTQNVTFGWTISIIPTDDDPTGHSIPIPGATVYNDSLRCNIYEPVGDTMAARPTVIMIHTGSFLPVFYNGQTTGQKLDSAITEMCRQFARRGYTAIAVDYRAGWNPVSTDQEVRTGSLLQAAGRGIQDLKACVRYFRNNALNGGNTWHIDERKIILGGMGTGGYIALGYATVDDYAKITLPKFTATVDNLAYGFMADSGYFAASVWGDIDGYGGLPFMNNSGNTPGIANDVAFAFNMGGAMGDSSWLDAGHVPMVCFHPMNDPFAPYNIGPVIVPTTGGFVIEAFGSYYVVDRADSLNNNAAFQNNTWTDPYTVRANMLNNGNDGLFPFDLPDPPGPVTGQAGPWEWYDSTTVYAICMGLLGFTQGHTDTIWYSSLATNPDMSRNKGIAYIDTVMGYLNPRISASLGLPTGIHGVPGNELMVKVFPNPSNGHVTCEMNGMGRIDKVEMFDARGQKVYGKDNISGTEFVLNSAGLTRGMYIVKIQTDKGEVVRKISLQ